MAWFSEDNPVLQMINWDYSEENFVSCIVSDLLEQVNEYLVCKIGAFFVVLTALNNTGVDTDIFGNNNWDDSTTIFA